MTTHQAKKLDSAGLLAFRDRFALPMSDADTQSLAFYKPRRRQRRDPLPAEPPPRPRRRAAGAAQRLPRRWPVPELEATAAFALHADGKEMSTTMAFVRILGNLMKDEALGPRVVPIVADEARTFGMASLFRTVGIYAPFGQLYQPEDSGSMLYYREDKSGQILEEGITEAGALSSWTAAATSYSTHGLAMLPFYIYYSMFGFQRVGDLIWAAADQRARGFLIGATAGRTTLGGEGLQHQDGSSHLVAATVPNCRAYDPATAGELAVILDRGMREMLVEQKDVFYYVTAMNENLAQPSLPAEAHEGVLRGMYRFRASASDERKARPAARARARCSARRSRPRRCWRPSTAWPPTSGASPASASWRAPASPPRPRGGTARPARSAATSASSSRRRAGRSSSPPTTCARCRSRSAPSCRRAGAA